MLGEQLTQHRCFVGQWWRLAVERVNIDEISLPAEMFENQLGRVQTLVRRQITGTAVGVQRSEQFGDAVENAAGAVAGAVVTSFEIGNQRGEQGRVDVAGQFAQRHRQRRADA